MTFLKGLVATTIAFLLLCAVVGLVWADDPPEVEPLGIPVFADFDISLKQGVLMRWTKTEDTEPYKFDNISTFTLARTKKVDTWNDWQNAIWTGWTIDGGIAYDANAIDTVALLLGREVGTLGDYLPIEFPLADKIDITLYPIGLYGTDIFSDAHFGVASGGAYFKCTIKLGE